MHMVIMFLTTCQLLSPTLLLICNLTLIIAVNFSVPDDSQPEVRVEIKDIIENTPAATASQDKAAINWVPTRSTINVTLLPIYSRSTVEQFNLKDFVNGKYVIDGKGFI